MKDNQNHLPERKRLLCLSLLIVLLFSLLVAQFYQIQVVDVEYWSKIADRQHYFIVNEPFKRGTFISNPLKQGHPESPQVFTIDVQKSHLYIDPLSIPAEHRLAIIKMLESTPGLKIKQDDQKKISVAFERKSHSRKLFMWLERQTQEDILKWWLPYARQHRIARNAIFFVNDYKRSYPFGKLLGQVLHTIQDDKDLSTTQAKPTGGLELYFNDYLAGKQGKRRLMRSPTKALETGEVIAEPENGCDIHLTINHCLQAIAEEELAKGVIKSQAKSGFAVLMDPYTGDILALAQYPFFSPANYSNYFNDPSMIEHTKIKAITDANEPGSIMKAITLAIALKANEELVKRHKPALFDSKAITPTSNPNFPGRRKPLKDTHFHKNLNAQMAIQKSSNIYMAQLAEKIVHSLGNNWYRQRLQNDFGFGLKTGIELPAESVGALPTPGKKHPNGALEWSKGTPYILAIGHNIQTTTLQIARAYAVFANGGYLVRPTLIRKITQTTADGKKNIILDNTLPEKKQFPRVLSQKIAEEVMNAMKFTTKIGGTARRADIPGYTENGKTGTGDKAINGIYRPEHVCSSFVGIAPTSKPVFVLIVSIDEPKYGYEPGIGKTHHGGTCAAPVFREIGKRTLEYLGIPPDDPYGYPSNDPRYDATKADWIKEIKELQILYEQHN